MSLYYLIICAGSVCGARQWIVFSNLTLATTPIVPWLTTGLTLLRDASSLTCWLIRFPYSILLRPAKWSSFDRGLNWGHTTWSPHILPIDWCYDWLVACSVCRDMVTGVNILLGILSIEKYASDCMSTWYASYVPLPTTAVYYGQVNSETLQTIFHFKLCLSCPA